VLGGRGCHTFLLRGTFDPAVGRALDTTEKKNPKWEKSLERGQRSFWERKTSTTAPAKRSRGMDRYEGGGGSFKSKGGGGMSL